MVPEKSLVLDLDERGVASLTINRPNIHNAFDDQLIQHLLGALEEVETNPDARILVLRSEGKIFSAGADLRWMRRMANFSGAENLADAEQFAKLLHNLNTFSKPTIARVQGAAFGGGVGLVACCDVAVGCMDASFCLSEVRLGLIPAVISPYVVAVIGERTARRYFQTAEKFDAQVAYRFGLLHEVVELSELDSAIDTFVCHLLKGGPNALAATKDLIFTVAHQPATDEVIGDTAARITAVRASDEGKEGLNAFLKKRFPEWIKDNS